MTRFIVFWLLACALALYQLIRYLAGSKKHRKLLTNLMFIPFLFISLMHFEFPPYRMGPGPTYEVSYEKEQDGYYFFSNGTVASVEDVYISDETKENKKVFVQTKIGDQHANHDVIINGTTYYLRKDINEVFPDYSMYDKIVWHGSIIALAVFDIITTVKNIIDLNKKGEKSTDENEEKTQS